MLCVVYAVTAVAALIATWSQNLAYVSYVDSGNFLLSFAEDLEVGLAIVAVAMAAMVVWVDVL